MTPMVTLRGPPPHSHIMLGQPQVQLKQLQTGEWGRRPCNTKRETKKSHLSDLFFIPVYLPVPVVNPGVLTGSKSSPVAASLATVVQKNKLKEAGGTFRSAMYVPSTNQ